jgi:transcriptional regulator of heat shock response
VSTNPMQRIADLEAQLATALAANETLRTNGNGHVDVEKLIKQGFDRFGQTFREDYTGKLAGLIQPFIENTVRRCKETEEKQTALESLFKKHEAAVSKSASNMIAAFNALHEEAQNNWQAQRDLIQSDFIQVDKFAKWFRAELDKSGKENAKAVIDCQTAARACQSLTQKVSAPVEETIRHIEEIQSEGETAIKRAQQRLTKTYENLQRPVLAILSGVLVIALVAMLGLAWIIFRGNRNQLESNLQQLAEYSEQQKTEMKELFGKAMEEAREIQIDHEIKVKMWDDLMKSLPPQQRQTVIDKLRDQINVAERKRIDDQMKSSYEQMNGKKK